MGVYGREGAVIEAAALRRGERSVLRRIPAPAFRVLCLLAWPWLQPPPAAGQIPPDETWLQVESEHFVITYPERLARLAPRVAASAERARALLAERFVDPPGEPIQIALSDHADYSNGYASALPYNRIVVFARPPIEGESISHFDDWLDLVLVHEIVHAFHLEMTGTAGSILRAVFGRLPAAWPIFPSHSLPVWALEGIAVHYESKLTNAGRQRGSWHRMVLRAAALEGALSSLDQLSGDSPVWPAGHRPYVYGGAFFDYLAEQHGEEAVGEFARSAAGLWVPYRWNKAAKDAFGISFSEGWRQWRLQLVQEARAEARRAAQAGPITQPEVVARVGRLASQPIISPDGSKLAHLQSDGVAMPQIRTSAPGGGDGESLVRVNSMGSLSWTGDGGIVFSQLEYTDPYRISSDLYLASPGGRVTRLTRGERLSQADIARGDGRIVAVLEGSGTTELVIWDEREGMRPLTRPDPDEHWAWPRWSPDGSRIAAARWRSPALMDIVVLDATGAVVAEVTRDRALDTTPFWTPDGGALVWSSDRTGIPNIFAARLEEGSPPKAMQVTNVLGGATHPSVDPRGEWLYFASYREDGWHIARASYDPETWLVPQDSPPPPEPALRREAVPLSDPKPYGAGETLRPRHWMLTASMPERREDEAGRKTSVLAAAGGIAFSGRDLVGRHSYSLDARMSPRGRFYGWGSYRYQGWVNPTLSLRASQYHDASSSELSVRFQDGSSRPFFLIERERRVSLDASLQRARVRSLLALTLGGGVVRESLALQGFGGEEGPSISRPLPEATFGEATATLFASTTQRRAFSISPEDGARAIVRGRTRRAIGLASGERGGALDRSYREATGELSLYKALGAPGFANHVLALRSSVGVARGPGATETHFDVGGAGGVRQSVLGVALGGPLLLFPARGHPRGIRSGNVAWSVSAEYRVPLFVVDRGLGSMPLFFNRVHAALFYDAGNAWGSTEENPRRAAVHSAGAEVSVMLAPFHRWSASLRGGAGVPLGGGSSRFYLRMANYF